MSIFSAGPVPALRLADAPLPPEANTLRAEVRAFLVESRASGMWQAACDSWLTNHSVELTREFGRRGWLGMTWPREFGGGGRTALERYVFTEEVVAAGAPVAAHWVADRQTGPTLLRFGSDELKRALLPRMALGECYFAIGMSEPDSGSDLASVRTRAVQIDGGWMVSGTKLWTSQAHRSHFMLTLCRTSAVTDRRHEGLSQLIIDLASPGVEIRPIISMTGSHHFNEVILSDVFVPSGMVVGQVGEGWHQVTSELAYERSGPERFLSTVPLLAEFVRLTQAPASPEAATAIGRCYSRLRALRRLSLGVAAGLDAGTASATSAALVKDLGTCFEQEVVELVRLGRRTIADVGCDRLDELMAQAIVASPGFTLRGGTTEVLRTIVARALEAE